MEFETQFPKGFPEVGDVIRFTCNAQKTSGGVTAKQVTGRKHFSTVEVIVVGREFDEATGSYYLITSDDAYKNIVKEDGWGSQGWIPKSEEGPQKTAQNVIQFEEYRTDIHQLKIVRKHR